MTTLRVTAMMRSCSQNSFSSVIIVWDKERRVVARIEASASHADDMLRRGIDIRYVVTSLQGSDAARNDLAPAGRPRT